MNISQPKNLTTNFSSSSKDFYRTSSKNILKGSFQNFHLWWIYPKFFKGFYKDFFDFFSRDTIKIFFGNPSINSSRNLPLSPLRNFWRLCSNISFSNYSCSSYQKKIFKILLKVSREQLFRSFQHKFLQRFRSMLFKEYPQKMLQNIFSICFNEVFDPVSLTRH